MQGHMDHFRNAKLWKDGQLVLEGFEGFIGFREKTGHRKEWHGYFVVDAGVHLDPESVYTLTLSDGKTATIRGSALGSGGADNGQRNAVEFYVVGDLRQGGRGLSSSGRSARRPLSH